jgi:hypothetical protein
MTRVLDPFGERKRSRWRRTFAVLGCRLEVAADDRRLMSLASMAFGGLPDDAPRGRMPRLHLEIRLASGGESQARRSPAAVRTSSVGGLLCGAMSAHDFAIICPREALAWVSISEALLSQPYFARYELLEFAIYTLAARVRRLVPLHGACIAMGKRAVLMLGDSGAGKSTLAWQALAQGFSLLAEDAVFVAPGELRATGMPNYLHLLPASLRFIPAGRGREKLRAAPIIRRRSGARKHEIDLRKGWRGAMTTDAKLVAVVSLSKRRASNGALLRPLDPGRVRALLAGHQPYAAGQPGWREFLDRMQAVPLVELRRGPEPADAVIELRRWLVSRK